MMPFTSLRWHYFHRYMLLDDYGLRPVLRTQQNTKNDYCEILPFSLQSLDSNKTSTRQVPNQTPLAEPGIVVLIQYMI